MGGDRSQQPQPNFPSGQYPNIPPQYPSQGQYPNMAPQYPPQGQYPNMAPQYPPQGQYPNMAPQYPPQGQYTNMAPQCPAPGQYPNMTPQYPSQAPNPSMPPQYSNMPPQYHAQAPNSNVPFGHAPIQKPHQAHYGANSAPPMPRYMVVCDENSKMKVEFMNSKVVKNLFPLHATTINTICNSTLFNSSSDVCVFLTQVANICVACARNGQVHNESLEQINIRNEKLAFPLQSSVQFVNEICKALQIPVHHDRNIIEKLAEKGYIYSSAALEYAIQLKFARMTYRSEMTASELKYNLINCPDFNLKYLQ